ncbi:MAG: Stealth CR1 domain-containing protein [Pseudomonadota bacterium]
MSQPIDAVLTWVDGEDPAHVAKRSTYDPGFGAAGVEATRFASRDEIRFSLSALLKFAPWLHQIHIVTDGQVPGVVQELWADPVMRARVKIVDHAVIYRGHEDLLPVFSSRSIETALYRIPDLAERFLYLNDDFFLIRPVQKTDFFDDTGPVLRGRWMSRAYGLVCWLQLLAGRLKGRGKDWRPSGFKAGQLNAARLAAPGWRFFSFGHTPHALRRSTLQRFQASHPGVIEANMAWRFRHGAQFNPTSLACQLELAAGTATIAASDNTVYFRADVDKPERVRAKIAEAEARDDALFICVNSLDQATTEVQADILGFLQRRIL